MAPGGWGNPAASACGQPLGHATPLATKTPAGDGSLTLIVKGIHMCIVFLAMLQGSGSKPRQRWHSYTCVAGDLHVLVISGYAAS